ncbi:ATP-binding cassette domain-containing protein [Candidatus Sumerlaeota bacterium]|nr:ATP-binding cassette domain-containing protein [Candidatus Sumerlaeota bacterium]
MEEKATSDQAAISVRDLSKVYHVRSGLESRWLSLVFPRHISRANLCDHWVVRDISFDVPRGRKLAIIGANGAGKSTLLKMIAGVVKPTSGQISVHGSVMPLLELGVGFHPELSGYENIFLQGALLGLTRERIRQRLPDIVAFSGLRDFMDTPVKYYSSGMFARLGFSVAIHCEPDILLVDEILSVGDMEFQEKSLIKIMDFVGQGRTLILVSHAYEIREICDEAIWLDRGQIRAQGDPRDVADAYVHHYLGRRKEVGALEEDTRLPSQRAVADTPGLRKIAAIRLLDSRGQPCEKIRSLDPMAIEIECEADQQVGDIICRVLLMGPGEVELLQIDSASEGVRLSLPAGKSTIRISIASFIVKQGNYDIEARLYSCPCGSSASVLATARSRLAVVNPDGVATNWFFDLRRNLHFELVAAD